MADQVGAMRERLVIQRNLWPTLAVVSITRSGTVATVTTLAAHGFISTDYVTVTDATPTGYNGKVKITVTNPTTFTYAVDGSLNSPATGTIAVTYTSDAQGGRKANWVPLATIYAELIPLTGIERLQVGTVQAIVSYQFRVRVRQDLSPKQRALWTPRWPVGAPTRSLEINGVLPWNDPWSAGMRYAMLQCSEVAA